MTNISNEFFNTLMRTQFMPPDDLRNYQRGLIEQLLRHARAHVPFYRDSGRLDPLFKPDDRIDWDRWEEVPVLTRRDAQRHAEQLYAETVPPQCGDVISGYTAGSTGTPLAFRINALMGAVGSAMLERGLVWAGLPAQLSMAWFRNDRQGTAAYPHGKSYHSVIRGTSRFTHHLSVQTPVALQGLWLSRMRPDIVMSYPSTLALLAQNLPATLAEHAFKLAICVGEITTEEDRATISSAFHCPVLDLYSGNEFGPVAVEDVNTRRRYVCEETSLVEFVSRGGDFAEGSDEIREVILTPFYNYAMPLIRYAPGDFAVVDPAPSPDLRILRRLERVVGRTRNCFILPSGQRWLPTYQNKILCDFLDYRQIQFAQTAPERIEIRFASDLAEPIKNAEKLHAYLRAATPEPMDIALTRIEHIAQRASGKYEYTVCELDPAANAAHIDALPSAPTAANVVAAPQKQFFAPIASPPYRPKEAIHALVQAWQRTQYLPPAQLQRYQRNLLEPLLRHARARVPFYRDSGRLDPVFRPDGTIDWERWTEIPPLTRREVQEAGDALYAESLPLDHGRTWEMMTSGSTGEPLRVVHDAMFGDVVWAAVFLRELEGHKIDPTQRLAYIHVFATDDQITAGSRRLEYWADQLAMAGIYGEALELDPTLPPARVIDELCEFRPRYLRGNPIRLSMLCNWDRDYRLRNLGIEAVMTRSEFLDQDIKDFISEHLQCKVVDRYASNECGSIAATCALCGRFHVHAESVHVEIMDDDGVPTRPGETGWVVATPLYNYAMPLIRYYHVDQARVGQPDLCPITLPTLDSVLGKEHVTFVFPGGIKVRPYIPPAAIINNLGAQIFQVAQVAEDRCEFRIVPGRMLPADMQFDEVTQLLRRRWWKDLKIDYRIVDELPGATPRGKPVTFVLELPQ